MIKDNEARFEEEDALEDEMAESEKEEKVEDVYKFQGNAPPVKAYPRRSPRRRGNTQPNEEQDPTSPSAEESGDTYDYSIIDSFIGVEGFSEVDAEITRTRSAGGTPSPTLLARSCVPGTTCTISTPVGFATIRSLTTKASNAISTRFT